MIYADADLGWPGRHQPCMKSLFPGSWDDGTRTRARLSEYVRTLHGEDLALRELVDHEGREYARANLRFALLEF